MLERFGVGRCCCPECWVWSDDFNRADSEDPGVNWNESRGDAGGQWGIERQMLREPVEDRSSSSAGSSSTSTSMSNTSLSSSSSVQSSYTPGGCGDPIIFGTNPVPLRSGGEMHLSVLVIEEDESSSSPSSVDSQMSSSSSTSSSSSSSSSQSSNMYRGMYTIWPCCRTDAELGPVRVDFFHAYQSSTWIVRIYRNGVLKDEKQMMSAPIEQFKYGLWVCADHEARHVKAGVLSVGDEPAWADECDPDDGRYYAMGHSNGTIGAWLDNFYITELRAGRKTCSDCFCWCLDYVPKKELHGQYINAVHRADCLNGISWDMDWHWGAGASYWSGSSSVPATPEGGLLSAHNFRLTCSANNDNNPAWPGQNFNLQFSPSSCCAGNPGGCDAIYQPIAELSSCDPFSLVFGPFYLLCDDLSCFMCFPPMEPGVSGFVGPLCDWTDPDTTGEYYIVITE